METLKVGWIIGGCSKLDDMINTLDLREWSVGAVAQCVAGSVVSPAYWHRIDLVIVSVLN